MVTIYKIENLINSKCYVGSTINYARRKRRHFEDLKQGKHHSIKLQRAYKKYGLDAFKITELESFEFSSKEYLLSREQYYLDILNPEYNICLIAGSQLGTKRNDEFRKKCSERMKGKSPWNKGLKIGKQSDEWKLRRSISLTGRIHSQATKDKISKIQSGRKLTIEHRLKLSKAKIKHGKYLKQKRNQIHYGE